MELTDGRLTQKQIDEIEQKYNFIPLKYKYYQEYVLGRNPGIMSPAPKTEPDNRVPTPMARTVVHTRKGYGYRPGYITYSTEGDFYDRLKDVFDENDEELHTSELAYDALSYGVAYEILRVNPELGIRIYKAHPGTMIPVYDGTLETNLIAAIHHVKDTIENTETRTIYYADAYRTEVRKDGGPWVLTEDREHPFGGVPVVVYTMNPEMLPCFEPTIPLIDQLDKVMSVSYANDRDKYANAYLMLRDSIPGGSDDEKIEWVNQLLEYRIFENMGGPSGDGKVQDSASYLVKPSRGAEVAEEADRLERLIKQNNFIIDTYDPSFGGATGIALAYKLLPLEWATADSDGYFDKGLQRRIELIGNALNSLRGVQPEMVTINHRRNVPADLATAAMIAGALKGILSDETILNLFPADIVPDVTAELERLEAQGPSLPPINTDEPDTE